MPYFVGILLELQLTTVQDHSLFHSRAVFDRPLAATGEMISTYDGLISFIVHPEYTVRDRKGAYIGPCRSTSRNLLEERNVWSAFPAEIYYWWGDCSPNKPGAKCAWRIRTRQRVGTACLCQHHRRSVLIPDNLSVHNIFTVCKEPQIHCGTLAFLIGASALAPLSRRYICDFIGTTLQHGYSSRAVVVLVTVAFLISHVGHEISPTYGSGVM